MSAGADSPLGLSFEAEVICWRGPSPFFFVPVPAPQAAELRRVANAVSYGWGMIPVTATVAEVAFATALFPKDDTYLLPLKAAVRKRIGVTAGDRVFVEMAVRSGHR